LKHNVAIFGKHSSLLIALLPFPSLSQLCSHIQLFLAISSFLTQALHTIWSSVE